MLFVFSIIRHSFSTQFSPELVKVLTCRYRECESVHKLFNKNKVGMLIQNVCKLHYDLFRLNTVAKYLNNLVHFFRTYRCVATIPRVVEPLNKFFHDLFQITFIFSREHANKFHNLSNKLFLGKVKIFNQIVEDILMFVNKIFWEIPE